MVLPWPPPLRLPRHHRLGRPHTEWHQYSPTTLSHLPKIHLLMCCHAMGIEVPKTATSAHLAAVIHDNAGATRAKPLPPRTRRERVLSLVKKYGPVALGTHVTLSCLSLTTLFSLVRVGVDLQSWLPFPSTSTPLNDLVLTFMMYKALMPVRLSMSVAATPLVARALGVKERRVPFRMVVDRYHPTLSWMARVMGHVAAMETYGDSMGTRYRGTVQHLAKGSFDHYVCMPERKIYVHE